MMRGFPKKCLVGKKCLGTMFPVPTYYAGMMDSEKGYKMDLYK